MQKNQNSSKRIFLKSIRQWVEVSEEFYCDHTRYYDALRKRQQSHGQCSCPKSKFWLCDGDCLTCEFHCHGEMLSLDHTLENEDGDSCCLLDTIPDPSPSVDEIVCNKAELEELYSRLNDLMPEAVEIGKLRQDGLSDEQIAKALGIKRTTFLSRLKKVKALLADEYQDWF